MATFSERLAYLMEKNDKVNKEMASLLGVDPSLISHYLNGKRNPPSDKLSFLAEYFDVSIDYLLGKSDNPYHIDIKEDPNITPEALEIAKELSFLSPEAQKEIMPHIQGMINMAKKMKKD